MTYQEFKNYISNKHENWSENWNPVLVLQCATIIAMCDAAKNDDARNLIWEQYKDMVEAYFKS